MVQWLRGGWQRWATRGNAAVLAAAAASAGWVLSPLSLASLSESPCKCSGAAAPQRQSASRGRSATVGVYSDFDPLQAVVIGRATGFQLPVLDADLLINEYAAAERVGVPKHVLKDIYDCDPEWDERAFQSALGRQFPPHMVQAANAALDNLAVLLRARGVKVLRTGLSGMREQRATVGNRGYSARDMMIAIGDTLFITPTPFCSRSREVDEVYGHILKELQDTHIVDLRTPAYWKRLRTKPGGDFALRTDGEDGSDIPLTEEIPLFDAANIFVLNDKTVVYLVSASANRAGAELLRQELKPMGMDVLELRGVYGGTHIDTTVLPLSRTKMIFNAERLTLEQMEEYFGAHGYSISTDSFIGISNDDLVPIETSFLRQGSDWIAMNVLQINPCTVLIEAKQTLIAAKLEAHGFEVIPVHLPFTRDFSGSLHCVTAPLRRQRGDPGKQR